MGRIAEPCFKHGPQDVEGELHDSLFAIVMAGPVPANKHHLRREDATESCISGREDAGGRPDAPGGRVDADGRPVASKRRTRVDDRWILFTERQRAKT